jgi:hypothetical protein
MKVDISLMDNVGRIQVLIETTRIVVHHISKECWMKNKATSS